VATTPRKRRKEEVGRCIASGSGEGKWCVACTGIAKDVDLEGELREGRKKGGDELDVTPALLP
jgi:hypothetical protein